MRFTQAHLCCKPTQCCNCSRSIVAALVITADNSTVATRSAEGVLKDYYCWLVLQNEVCRSHLHQTPHSAKTQAKASQQAANMWFLFTQALRFVHLACFMFYTHQVDIAVSSFFRQTYWLPWLSD